MFDFIRMLYLSGILLESEQLPLDTAERLFRHYGATDQDLKPQNLRKTFFTLAKKYHPDMTGGDHKPMQYINAAYEVLSKAAKSTSTEPPMGVQPVSPTSAEPPTGGQPASSDRKRIPCPNCKREIISTFTQCPWCKTMLKSH